MVVTHDCITLEPDMSRTLGIYLVTKDIEVAIVKLSLVILVTCRGTVSRAIAQRQRYWPFVWCMVSNSPVGSARVDYQKLFPLIEWQLTYLPRIMINHDRLEFEDWPGGTEAPRPPAAAATKDKQQRSMANDPLPSVCATHACTWIVPGCRGRQVHVPGPAIATLGAQDRTCANSTNTTNA